MSTEPKLGTCSNPRHAPGRYLVRNPHEKLDDCDDWREVESAPAQPTGKTIEAIRNYRPERELPSAGDSRKAAVPPAAETAEQLAQLFHETYERLAPQFGYATRNASAKPWADVPDRNKALMTAVCAELAAHVREAAQEPEGIWAQQLEAAEKRTQTALGEIAGLQRGFVNIYHFVTDKDCDPKIGIGMSISAVCQLKEKLETAERKLAELEKVLLALLAETCGCSSGDPNWHSSRCRMPKISAALASLRCEKRI